jgi:hypothetical protein
MSFQHPILNILFRLFVLFIIKYKVLCVLLKDDQVNLMAYHEV